MKKIFLLLGLAILTASAGYQGTNTDKDPKAKVILDKLSKKHKTMDNIVIDFTATFSSPKIKKTVLKGTAYKSGKKYAYYTPDYVVVNNGTYNWLYVKSDNEVTITDNDGAEEENGLVSPSKLLSIWEKGFKYKFIGEGKVGGKMLQEVRLFPENPKKSKYHTITLIINKTKNELSKVTIKGRDGVDMVYDLKKFKSGQTIAASKFKFDKSKYPNCKENDQRF